MKPNAVLSIIFMALLVVVLLTNCQHWPWEHEHRPTPTPTSTPTPQPTATPTPDIDTVIGVSGTNLTINGVPTWIQGISLYGILSYEPARARDTIDRLVGYGFNWCQVWVGWNRCTHDASVWDLELHHWVDVPTQRIRDFVAYCNIKGMIVNVKMHYASQDFQASCNQWNRTCDGPHDPNCPAPSEPARTIPVLQSWCENVCILLADLQNWDLDPCNEHLIADGRYVSPQEFRQIRDAIKARWPDRLITSSSDNTDLWPIMGIDYGSPHLARLPSHPYHATVDYFNAIGNVGIPVMLQEPFRNGFPENKPNFYTYIDYCNDTYAAKHTGQHAAGWCLHNSACFDLNVNDFWEELYASELRYIEQWRQCPDHIIGDEGIMAEQPVKLNKSDQAVKDGKFNHYGQ